MPGYPPRHVCAVDRRFFTYLLTYDAPPFCVCGLRPPRCVSTGPVVVRLAEMANKREREREPSFFGKRSLDETRSTIAHFGLDIGTPVLEVSVVRLWECIAAKTPLPQE